ncbi:MAG: hypothetical protein QOD42_2690 [Sphingomonadales bacterium]|jgi:hypothetical protein|nr:hypothetical protein [Sphingomonadales bacterium]
MAGSSLFGNAARLAAVAALLLFLLPWTALSYSPREMGNALGMPDASTMFGSSENCPIVRASGLQLAMGSAAVDRECRGVLADLVPETNPDDDPDNPFAKAEIPVIAGALLLVLTLIAGVPLKGRAAAIAAALGPALAAAAFCYSVLMRIPAALRDAPDATGGPDLTADQLAQIIQVTPQFGFWLEIVALLAAIVLALLAARTPRPAAAPPPA